MLFLPSPSLTFFLTTSSISSLSVFFTSCLLFTSVPVSGEEEMGDSDVQAVRDLYLQSSMFNNIFHLSTSQPGIFYGYQALGLYAGSGLHEGVLSGWKEQRCRKSEGHGEARPLQQGLEGCLYEYMLEIFGDFWWHSLTPNIPNISNSSKIFCDTHSLTPGVKMRRVWLQRRVTGSWRGTTGVVSKYSEESKIVWTKTLSVSITENAFS